MWFKRSPKATLVLPDKETYIVSEEFMTWDIGPDLPEVSFLMIPKIYDWYREGEYDYTD